MMETPSLLRLSWFQSERAVARAEANSTSVKEELDGVRRPDLGGELKYSQMRDWLQKTDVFKSLRSIVERITDATRNTVCASECDCGDPQVPAFGRNLKELRAHPQPWRRTLTQQREEARLLRAREHAEDEEGWAL